MISSTKGMDSAQAPESVIVVVLGPAAVMALIALVVWLVRQRTPRDPHDGKEGE